jgi:hypothetical protein
MWQHILALPLVAKAIGLAVLVGMALWGSVKHKAVAKISSAATNAAESKFWGWVWKKLHAAAPSAITAKPSNEKTYRSTFLIYSRYANSKEHFFTIERDGVTETVSVTQTNKLSAVQRGDFVEIDTQVGLYYGEEVVQRVRVGKSLRPRGPTAQGPAGY